VFLSLCCFFFFFSSRRRHTSSKRDWSSDVCSSDLLFFVTRLCLLHVRYNLCFHRFANHNFHVFALCQYLRWFYFLVLFDYEIACLLVQLISLFAFYKPHSSYVKRSFLGGTNVRHFCSFPATTSK